MDAGAISAERRGAVLLVTFDRRRDANMFDPASFVSLANALGRLHAERDIRCAVLAAEGPDFTNGLEPGNWGAIGRLPAGAADPLQLDESDRLPVPLLMAAQGRCLAVGFELMLAADVRVAAADSVFGYVPGQESYPGGPSLRLAGEVGWEAADPFLRGAAMTADEGYRLGIINEVTDGGRHLDRALYLAGRISAADPALVAAQLKAFRRGRSGGLKQRLAESFLGLPPGGGAHPASG